MSALLPLLPLSAVGAGLPFLPSLAGNAKSYAERLFRFPDVGALSEEESAQAIRKPMETAGVHIEDVMGCRFHVDDLPPDEKLVVLR